MVSLVSSSWNHLRVRRDSLDESWANAEHNMQVGW